MGRLAVGLALVAGCSFDATGTGETEVGSSSSTTQAASTTTTSSATSSGSTGSSTSSTSSTSSSGSSSGSSTEAAPLPTSCEEILEADPSAPNEIYSLQDAEELEYDAYCLMDFEGGGWLLAGRSVPGGGGVPFGWGDATGDVADTNIPYSLDVWARGVPLTEILIGDRAMGQYAPASRAYVLEVLPGFLEDCADADCLTESVRTVLGDCDPLGGPAMFSHVGYTTNDDAFFMRDIAGNEGLGLRANGFALFYDDCELGALLNGEQGLLYVR